MFIINADTIREELHKTSWAHDFDRFETLCRTGVAISEISKERPMTKQDMQFIHEFAEKMSNAADFIENNIEAANAYIALKRMFTAYAVSPADFEYGLFGNIIADALPSLKKSPTCEDIEEIERIASVGYIPVIEKIVSKEPYSIVYFADGSKTKVKCDGNDKFDPRTGVYLALLKKAIGSKNLRHLFNLLSDAIPADTDSETSDTEVNSEIKENSPSDENEMPDGMESVNIDDLAEV